jgi:hypothetical protein
VGFELNMSTWDDKPNDYEHAVAMCRELRAENELLRDLATTICWFDWSSNDEDAVAAIDRLRRALRLLKPEESKP